MKLNEQDYYAFMKIYQSILLWAGKKADIIPAKYSLDNFYNKVDLQKKFKCREFFHSSDDHLHQFLMDDIWLTPDEHAEAEQFVNKITGEFLVLKALKKHYIFLHDKDVYGILALNNFIEELIYPFPAYLGNVVLLPFRGKIVYDGFFAGNQIRFGRNITRGFMEQYNEAKKRKEIIVAL